MINETTTISAENLQGFTEREAKTLTDIFDGQVCCLSKFRSLVETKNLYEIWKIIEDAYRPQDERAWYNGGFCNALNGYAPNKKRAMEAYKNGQPLPRHWSTTSVEGLLQYNHCFGKHYNADQTRIYMDAEDGEVIYVLFFHTDYGFRNGQYHDVGFPVFCYNIFECFSLLKSSKVEIIEKIDLYLGYDSDEYCLHNLVLKAIEEIKPLSVRMDSLPKFPPSLAEETAGNGWELVQNFVWYPVYRTEYIKKKISLWAEHGGDHTPNQYFLMGLDSLDPDDREFIKDKILQLASRDTWEDLVNLVTY